jgi:hypothetical protein
MLLFGRGSRFAQRILQIAARRNRQALLTAGDSLALGGAPVGVIRCHKLIGIAGVGGVLALVVEEAGDRVNP